MILLYFGFPVPRFGITSTPDAVSAESPFAAMISGTVVPYFFAMSQSVSLAVG